MRELSPPSEGKSYRDQVRKRFGLMFRAYLGEFVLPGNPIDFLSIGGGVGEEAHAALTVLGAKSYTKLGRDQDALMIGPLFNRDLPQARYLDRDSNNSASFGDLTYGTAFIQHPCAIENPAHNCAGNESTAHAIVHTLTQLQRNGIFMISAGDRTHQAAIVNLLRRVQAKLGLTVTFHGVNAYPPHTFVEDSLLTVGYKR